MSVKPLWQIRFKGSLKSNFCVYLLFPIPAEERKCRQKQKVITDCHPDRQVANIVESNTVNELIEAICISLYKCGRSSTAESASLAVRELDVTTGINRSLLRMLWLFIYYWSEPCINKTAWSYMRCMVSGYSLNIENFHKYSLGRAKIFIRGKSLFYIPTIVHRSLWNWYHKMCTTSNWILKEQKVEKLSAEAHSPELLPKLKRGSNEFLANLLRCIDNKLLQKYFT